MRTKTLRMLTIALVAGAALLASAASAAVLQGRGELHAAGNGSAVLEMGGVLTVPGGGVLIVQDDVQIETQGVGRRTDLGDGRVLYEGYGRAIIESRDPTRIKISRARIRLHAQGAGRALLEGCGVIRTDDVDVDWADDLELEFDSE